MRRVFFLALFLFGWHQTAGPALAETPLAETYLTGGQLADGEKGLLAHLRDSPRDDEARFGLGVIQFVRSLERLSQDLHRYGLRDSSRHFGNLIPVLRLPVPDNPDPETLTYDISRRIVQTWLDGLAKADVTFARVTDADVKLRLHVGQIKIDRTGRGTRLDSLFQLLALWGIRAPADARNFVVCFDRGDVCWFRGYCHLLSALGEVVLAHDGQELFDTTAHLFFKKVQSPHDFLQQGSRSVFRFNGDVDIADLIAFVHVLRMPVKEPARMKAALQHLEEMLIQSRQMWKFVLAETDDDNEWIPNPKQRGALGVPVTREMVDGWLEFLYEAESLLQGKRLVPFWRGKEDDPRGVNLRRVFTEPRSFDLVLWVQGTAATPYLEKGQLTRPDVWARLVRVFRGEFIGFALWFN